MPSSKRYISELLKMSHEFWITTWYSTFLESKSKLLYPGSCQCGSLVSKAWPHVATPTDICWKRPNHDLRINTYPQQMSVEKKLRRMMVSLIVKAWLTPMHEDKTKWKRGCMAVSEKVRSTYFWQSFLIGAIGVATIGASSIRSTIFTLACRPSGADESVTKTTKTEVATATEDQVVAEVEVLLATVVAEYWLPTLALSMSSIACIESLPQEDIINTCWRNVGGFFFGAIVWICQNRQGEYKQRV